MAIIERVKTTNIKPSDKINEILRAHGTTELSTGVKLAELIKRTELDYEMLAPIDAERPELSKEEREEVNIEIKYEGYIKLQLEQIEGFKKLENKKFELEQAENNYNLEQAAILRHGTIPKLEQDLKDLKKVDESQILSDTVDDNAIAEIISKWTKIPVKKLIQQ